MYLMALAFPFLRVGLETGMGKLGRLRIEEQVENRSLRNILFVYLSYIQQYSGIDYSWLCPQGFPWWGLGDQRGCWGLNLGQLLIRQVA